MSKHYDKPIRMNVCPIKELLEELNINCSLTRLSDDCAVFANDPTWYEDDYRYRIEGCDFDTVGYIDYIKCDGHYYYPEYNILDYGDDGEYTTSGYYVSDFNVLTQYRDRLKTLSTKEIVNPD